MKCKDASYVFSSLLSQIFFTYFIIYYMYRTVCFGAGLSYHYIHLILPNFKILRIFLKCLKKKSCCFNNLPGTREERKGSILSLLRHPMVWFAGSSIIVCAVGVSFLDPTLAKHLENVKRYLKHAHTHAHKHT